MDQLDARGRQIVGGMIAMQQQTHDRLSALKRRMS
jgi:hypothetical protein